MQRDGIIRLGRPDHRIGAHCKGFNAMSIGIAAIGNFEETCLGTETQDQMEALRLLLQDLLFRHKAAEVKMHCEFSATKCPGKHLIKWLENFDG